MGAEGGGTLEGGILNLPLGPLPSVMLQKPPLWICLEGVCVLTVRGPLEQALWNAWSPPKHKAAAKYFLGFP